MLEILRLQIHTAAAAVFAVWPAVSTGLLTSYRCDTTLKTASVYKGSPLKRLNKNQTKRRQIRVNFIKRMRIGKARIIAALQRF